MELDMKTPLVCDAQSDTRADMLQTIANTYGLKNQRIQAVQELSELIMLLTRRKDQIEKDPTYKEHLTEEIADSIVMVQQIMYLEGIDSADVETVIEYKLSRQIDRINHGKRFAND